MHFTGTTNKKSFLSIYMFSIQNMKYRLTSIAKIAFELRAIAWKAIFSSLYFYHENIRNWEYNSNGTNKLDHIPMRKIYTSVCRTDGACFSTDKPLFNWSTFFAIHTDWLIHSHLCVTCSVFIHFILDCVHRTLHAMCSVMFGIKTMYSGIFEANAQKKKTNDFDFCNSKTQLAMHWLETVRFFLYFGVKSKWN